MFPGSWRQVPRIKSDAGERSEGRGARGDRSAMRSAMAPRNRSRGVWCPGLNYRPLDPRRHASEKRGHGGARNAHRVPKTCPPTQNGRRAARRLLSAAAVFRPLRSRPAASENPARSFQKKGGGRLTLRMAHGLLQESERAARRPALFRALPKCPATPLPTPVGGGRRLRLAYFVAERGDPRLSLVELLLEVAVLRKHGGAGSGQLSGGSGARGAPRAAAPRPASQAARSAPQVP